MQQICHITGQSADAADMLRFVRAPDGVLTPDLGDKLSGESVYVLNQKALMAQLAARDTVPHDLPLLIDTLMRRQLKGLLGLARKAGDMVTGFAKVEAALARGDIFLLLAAADGAADGRAKLANRAARNGIKVMSALTADELGMALGRANVIHAGATNAGWAAKIDQQARRLTAFNGSPDSADRSESA